MSRFHKGLRKLLTSAGSRSSIRAATPSLSPAGGHDMRRFAFAVGAVEETVTVTGASPIVDTQSTQNQAVLNRQVLDVLPAARTMQGGAALVPGVSFYSQGFVSTMSIHGSATADQHIFFDGMNIGQNLTGTG